MPTRLSWSRVIADAACSWTRWVSVISMPPRWSRRRCGYHDLGNVLRRHNRRRDARAAQEHAATLASQAQTRCLLAAVRDQLGILGAKPRRWAFSGLESLTASERRTADLAAARLTNRETAEQLFVTRKTVEGHLAHACRKLAISSREELAQAMAVSARMRGG